MVILLDTHYLLWSLSGEKRLTAVVRRLPEDPGQPVKFSMASAWEVGIKLSIGKLQLQHGLASLLGHAAEQDIDLLPISTPHIELLSALPPHHRDPFDRMLIAQAKHEGMHLLAADPHFKLYDVPLVDL